MRSLQWYKRGAAYKYHKKNGKHHTKQAKQHTKQAKYRTKCINYVHVRGYSYPRTWVAMTTYVGTNDQNDGHPCPKPWVTMPYIVGHKYPKAWASLGIVVCKSARCGLTILVDHFLSYL